MDKNGYSRIFFCLSVKIRFDPSNPCSINSLFNAPTGNKKLVSSRLGDGHQVPLGAKEEHSLGNSGSRHTNLSHVILSKHLEFGSRLDHINVAVLTRVIELPV